MEPITREEILIEAAATGKTPSLTPITREEMFLAKEAGMDVNVPEPITRKEMFLSMITGSGDSGEVVDGLEIVPDFSAGDYEVVAPTGLLVRSAIIKKPKTLVPDNIAQGVEIAGVVGTHVGGGSSADERVKYVTFVYEENGETKEYSYPVINGDTCRDPVANGYISAPTKESTVQYNYTYYGWGASDGGAADANILKNITEDKTVYAIFAATARLYTITWLDDDGSVLKAEQLAYGTVPSYKPAKDGVVFVGWTPTIVAVTGNASYTASWSEQITFADGQWADIARISESGQAANHFAIGDKKTLTFSNLSGQSVTVNMEIVAFNHDNLADGSGKAGITVMTETVAFTDQHGTSSSATSVWKDSKVRSHLRSSVLPSFPTELKNVIKAVTKEYGYYNSTDSVEEIATIADTIWIPSAGECGFTTGQYVITGDGTPYTFNLKKVYTHDPNQAAQYHIRTGSKSTMNPAAMVTTEGKFGTNSVRGISGVAFGFCI